MYFCRVFNYKRYANLKIRTNLNNNYENKSITKTIY